MDRAQQFLDCVSTQEEPILTYSTSKMILATHSDAGYLNVTNARSRAGGHFFLRNIDVHPANNGAILNIAQIIKNVMSSAAKSELGALYIVAREAVYIRSILSEFGAQTSKNTSPDRQLHRRRSNKQQNTAKKNQSYGYDISLTTRPSMSKTI